MERKERLEDAWRKVMRQVDEMRSRKIIMAKKKMRVYGEDGSQL